MTIEYLISFAAAVVLLIAYSLMVKNKEFWLTMLFCCVPVVNLGYSLLSMAKTVGFAIFANNVAYLGSVFLSMCMFLTIVRLCGFEIKKKHIITCVSLGVVMFAIVATSGILPWYYKSVELDIVDGSAKLVKEYGVLHSVYLFYLLGYFAAMIGAIILSVKKKMIAQTKYAAFIAGVVCINILMWLFEKFVSWNYEFLSVTYIGSELLLLLVYWMMQDYVHKNEVPSPVIVEEKAPIIIVDNMTRAEKIRAILDSLPDDTVLSTRQMDILERILDYKSRKEIAVELHLSENTVKTHTGMLYKALGVSGRDEIYAMFQK